MQHDEDDHAYLKVGGVCVSEQDSSIGHPHTFCPFFPRLAIPYRCCKTRIYSTRVGTTGIGLVLWVLQLVVRRTIS